MANGKMTVEEKHRKERESFCIPTWSPALHVFMLLLEYVHVHDPECLSLFYPINIVQHLILRSIK